MNLIEAWMAAETAIHNRTAADAIRDLNAALGRHYTHSHLSRWRRGVETPRADVLRYMAQASARETVQDVFGITASGDEVDSLIERMTP